MAKEGSVAPKERVNIVYRPATGDAQEEVELPLKMLIMGDFTQREDARTIEDREPINIDKDNFNDVMQEQNLSLNLTVPNKLSDNPDEEMSVKLAFDSLKDFNPDALAQNSPELKKLMELRQALTALKGPLSNVPEFRKKIQSLVKDNESKDQLLKELGVEDK